MTTRRIKSLVPNGRVVMYGCPDGDPAAAEKQWNKYDLEHATPHEFKKRAALAMTEEEKLIAAKKRGKTAARQGRKAERIAKQRFVKRDVEEILAAAIAKPRLASRK